MKKPDPTPGVMRQNRLSEEGLARLQRQLESGPVPATAVLEQWVKRYGDEAREIIHAAGIDIN